MNTTSGPHDAPVRDPGQTFGLRNVATPVGFVSPEARAAVRVVNDSHLRIEQLQFEIGKLDSLIAEEETTRGKLSEFVWAILHTISPLSIRRGCRGAPRSDCRAQTGEHSVCSLGGDVLAARTARKSWSPRAIPTCSPARLPAYFQHVASSLRAYDTVVRWLPPYCAHAAELQCHW